MTTLISCEIKFHEFFPCELLKVEFILQCIRHARAVYNNIISDGFGAK